MRKLAPLLILLGALFASVADSLAGTVDAVYNFADYSNHPLNVRRVTITPLGAAADYGGAELSQKPIIYNAATYPNLTNGYVTVTNLITGYAYRVAFSDGYSEPAVTNYFGTNLSGTVSAYTNRTTYINWNAGRIVGVWLQHGGTASATNVTLRAGSNITITTNAPSDWTITSTGGSGGGSATNIGITATELSVPTTNGAGVVTVTTPTNAVIGVVQTQLSAGSNAISAASVSASTASISAISGVTVTASGGISGPGTGLSAVPASAIASGTIDDARLPATITSDITGNAATATTATTAATVTSLAGNAAQIAAIGKTNKITMYATDYGAVPFTGNVDVGSGGTDSWAALQALLFSVTNYTGGAEIVLDDKFLISKTLVMDSNTKLRGLNPSCGLVLSNNCNQFMLVNRLDGNNYASSNIMLCDFTIYGNQSNQNHFVTSTSPYYTGDHYAPVSSRTAVAHTIEGIDYWRPWLFAVWFSGVDGLVVRNMRFYNTETFALTVGGAVKNAVIEQNWFNWTTHVDPGNQDAIHVFGPFSGVIQDNVSNGNDDMIGFNIDELSYVTNAMMKVWRGTNGNCDTVVMKNNVHNNPTGGMLRLLAYNSSLGNNFVTNLTVSGLTGDFEPSGFTCGAVNSSWQGGLMYVENFSVRDIKTKCPTVSLDFRGVCGRSLSASDFTGYGRPSYANSYDLWNSDRFTPGYIYLNRGWEDVTLNNFHIFTTSTESNVALVSTRYAYSSTPIKKLSINNSSISGPGIRAYVANYCDIGTLSMNGVTTTNTQWIPDVFTAKTTEVLSGTTVRLSNPIGCTNYAEDTTLWLMKCRRSGYEPPFNQIAANDFGNRYLASTGDLTNIYEMGFFVGATNIAGILVKTRTYYTNEWTTNAYMTNSGFTTADLTPYGLRGNGTKFLGTQIPITTVGIGPLPKTNFSFGIYLNQRAAASLNGSYCGPSYTATGDTDRFGFVNELGAGASWLGSLYYSIPNTDTEGMLSTVVSNSAVTRTIYMNGTVANSTGSWNGGGFQAGTYLMMKGQYYAAASNNIVSFWYVGNGAVNQSNLNYAVAQMVAIASPRAFGSASNTLTVANSATVFQASTAVSITNLNLSAITSGEPWTQSLLVSNLLATSITGYCTVPNIRLIGTATTNALTIPAGKIGQWDFRGFNGTITNYQNFLQQ